MTDETSSSPRFVSAISTRRETAAAADELCDRIQARREDDDAPLDLGVLFFSADHTRQAELLERTVHERLGVRTLLAASGSGVVGGAMQIRGTPGVSLLAASLPGVTTRPFLLQDLPRQPEDADPDWARAHLAPIMGLDQPEARATFILTDPYSVPLVRLLPAIAAARPSDRFPILGGVASAGAAPGQNVISLNGGIMHVGGVGVTLAGDIAVDTCVSQGCQGFGPTMVVTRCRGNVLLELGGRRAMDAVRDAVGELPQERRSQLSRGLFVGRVIDEYKERFGRDDFLIRGVRGFDEDAGAVLTDDFFRVGQTVRLHLRDAQTADEDLGMLLDRERLRTPPEAALLITSNGRDPGAPGPVGRDAGAIARTFAAPLAGVHAAKGGQSIDPSEPTIPLAGLEAAGEIGPVGAGVFLHAQSAAIAFFRRRDRQVASD